MTSMLATEFGDVITVKSIGQTWEGRSIDIIELDARKMMEDKGVKEDVSEAPTPGKPVFAQEKKKGDDELSDEDLLEKNEDINRDEDNKKKEK